MATSAKQQRRVLFTTPAALSYAIYLTLGQYLAGIPKLLTASQGESKHLY